MNLIVKIWLQWAAGRQTVVFCADIQHGKDLAAAFNQANVSAECVWGTDPDRDRKLERHKRKQFRVLTNCNVLTEGYDDWRIGCVLLARPTKSEPFFTQMIGRGTRIEEGIDNAVEAERRGHIFEKKDCIIIDVVDSTKAHKVTTLATLLGHDAEYDFKGRIITEGASGRDHSDHRSFVESVVENARSITTVVEEIDLFCPHWTDDRLGRSVLQWFKTDDRFVCPLPDGGELVIIVIKIDHTFVASGNAGGQPFRSKPFSSFVEAMAIAETWLKSLDPGLLKKLETENAQNDGRSTPIQENLLRAASVYSLPAALTRLAAAEKIASAYEEQLSASRLSPQSSPANIAVETPTEVSFQRVFPCRWPTDLFEHSVLRWFETDDGGFGLPLPEAGQVRVHLGQNSWSITGEVDGIPIGAHTTNSPEKALEFIEDLVIMRRPQLFVRNYTEC